MFYLISQSDTGTLKTVAYVLIITLACVGVFLYTRIFSELSNLKRLLVIPVLLLVLSPIFIIEHAENVKDNGIQEIIKILEETKTEE